MGTNTTNYLSGSEGTAQAPAYNQNLQNAATNFQSQYGTNPYVQAAQVTTQGNILGAQAATAANRVNQSTPYGSLNYQQTGTDAQGNPIWSANQTLAPELQGIGSNLINQLQSSSANPIDVANYQQQSFNQNPNLQTGLENQGMAGWDKATGLMMQRLQPQMDRQSQRLETQLANQGIAPGTEAYKNAKMDLAQQQNDLMNQAALSGQQVQQNLFSQGLQAGQFGNTAQQQMYQNALANVGQQNAATQQNLQNALTANQLPLSQLGSFRTATAPSYINPYTQAAVAGPDVLGAYTSNQAQQIAQQNADAARQAALTGGLFQLGGSVLSNPTATGAISSGLGTIGKSLSDWWSGL